MVGGRICDLKSSSRNVIKLLRRGLYGGGIYHSLLRETTRSDTRHYSIADLKTTHVFSHFNNLASNLESYNKRKRWLMLIYASDGQYIREIYTSGLNPNPDLPKP